jgi:hypothetical protein
MKGFHLKFTIYSDVLAYSHGFGTSQNALYIPEKGIFGYDNKYFFTEDAEAIAGAQKVVDERNKNFIEEVKVPDKQVEEAIITGKNYNSTQSEFDKKVESLLAPILKTEEEELEISIPAVEPSSLSQETIQRL